jgi:hypothetical protein
MSEQMRSPPQKRNASLDPGRNRYFSGLMALILRSPQTGSWLRERGEFCLFTVLFAHRAIAPVTGSADGMSGFNQKKANLYIVRSA